MRYPPLDHKANRWTFCNEPIDGNMTALSVAVVHVHRGPGGWRYVFGANLFRLVEWTKVGPHWRRDMADALAHMLDEQGNPRGRLSFIRQYDARAVDDVLNDLVEP